MGKYWWICRDDIGIFVISSTRSHFNNLSGLANAKDKISTQEECGSSRSRNILSKQLSYSNHLFFSVTNGKDILRILNTPGTLWQQKTINCNFQILQENPGYLFCINVYCFYSWQTKFLHSMTRFRQQEI